MLQSLETNPQIYLPGKLAVLVTSVHTFEINIFGARADWLQIYNSCWNVSALLEMARLEMVDVVDGSVA